MSEKPELFVCLTSKGRLQYRLPTKGARWRGAHKDMASLVEEVIPKLAPPFVVRYVTEADKDKT